VTKLIHFSDLHVWREKGWDGDPCIKRLFGKVNLHLRRKGRYPPAWGRAILEAIAAREAAAVIFSGDVSSASLVGEFETGFELFAPLREKWDERFLIIPGNHDRYTPRATQRRLFEKHVLGRDREYPFAARIAEDIGVVGIDLSGPRPFTARGRLSEAELSRIAEKVERQRGETDFVVVVGHYPLVYPPDFRPSWQHVLPRREELAQTLVQAGASLYLHGHVHRRWVLRAAAHDGGLDVSHWAGEPSGKGPGMVCIDAGSAGMRETDPNRAAGFVEIKIDAGRVASVETLVLRPAADGPGLEVVPGPRWPDNAAEAG